MWWERGQNCFHSIIIRPFGILIEIILWNFNFKRKVIILHKPSIKSFLNYNSNEFQSIFKKNYTRNSISLKTQTIHTYLAVCCTRWLKRKALDAVGHPLLVMMLGNLFGANYTKLNTLSHASHRQNTNTRTTRDNQTNS